MGMPIDKAAIAVGVTPATLKRWMSEDEEIAMSIAEAEAICESELLTVLDNAVHGQDPKLATTTAQWMLERINPAAWGRTTRNDQYQKDRRLQEMASRLEAELGEPVDVSALRKELDEIEKKQLSSG